MPKTITVSVLVGNDTRTIELTQTEWDGVRDGKELTKPMQDFYEGQEFTYTFMFNSPDYPKNSLVVTYDSGNGDIGDGFIGNIDDVTTVNPSKR